MVVFSVSVDHNYLVRKEIYVANKNEITNCKSSSVQEAGKVMLLRTTDNGSTDKVCVQLVFHLSRLILMRLAI